MQYTALSYTNHADLKLIKRTFFHLKDQPMVGLSIAEAPRAALDLPLAFSRKSDHSLTLVAVLSLEKKDNPHITLDGSWVSGYMPAMIAGTPFALAYNEEKAVVVVPEKSDFLSREEGEALFEPEGKPTKLLDKLTILLKTRYPNPHRDNPVLEKIDQAGILEPWSDVSENLLKVDLEKLNALDDNRFLELKQKNILPVLYAQLMSMPRINRVKKLAKRKEQLAQRQAQQAEVSDFNLVDDETFNFDQ